MMPVRESTYVLFVTFSSAASVNGLLKVYHFYMTYFNVAKQNNQN